MLFIDLAPREIFSEIESVGLIFPAKAKEFAKYEGLKTKTDEIDAHTLSTIGCTNRKLKPWTPPKAIYTKLKQMCRFNTRMEKIRTELNNQLSTLKDGALAEESVIDRYEALLKSLDKQQEKNKKLIKETVDADPELAQKVEKLTTIKGIGYDTIVSILAETDGFNLISSRKQLASYAGLDVISYKSGTIDIKHRISKKGNSHIRAALYWPAIAAKRHNPQMADCYNRIIAKNPKIKMIGITAIMRKLLLLVYTLWCSGEVYDPQKSESLTSDQTARQESIETNGCQEEVNIPNDCLSSQ